MFLRCGRHFRVVPSEHQRRRVGCTVARPGGRDAYDGGIRDDENPLSGVILHMCIHEHKEYARCMYVVRRYAYMSVCMSVYLCTRVRARVVPMCMHCQGCTDAQSINAPVLLLNTASPPSLCGGYAIPRGCGFRAAGRASFRAQNADMACFRSAQVRAYDDRAIVLRHRNSLRRKRTPCRHMPLPTQL